MKMKLLELRVKRGLKRRDVSNDTGISMNTLLNYEKGAVPSISQVERIAETYNVNPAWLLGYVDEQGQCLREIVKEKVVEKVVDRRVVIDRNVTRLPPYWNNDNDGLLIKWKQTKKWSDK